MFRLTETRRVTEIIQCRYINLPNECGLDFLVHNMNGYLGSEADSCAMQGCLLALNRFCLDNFCSLKLALSNHSFHIQVTHSNAPVDLLLTLRPNGCFESSTMYSGFSAFLVAVGTEIGTSNRELEGSVIC